MASQSSIDSMVFDFFLRGTETIIHERKASVQPMSSSSNSTDCSEYIRQTVQSWKRQLSRPMNIDLYIFNNVVNSHVLMERWNFSYTYSPDSSEISSTATVGQRIQVLMRSLYSFLRLLPGFNLLHCSQARPLMTMQIYDPKISPEAFRYESSNYSFPPVSTSKGTLAMSVSFTNPGVVKEILRAINGGSLVGLPSPSTIRVDKSDGKQHSASIPIPGRAPPVDPYRARVYSDSRDSQPRRSFKEEGSLTAALRADYAQARSLEARNGGEAGAFFPSSVGSSGPTRSGGGGGLLYPNSHGGSGEVPFGTSPSSHSGRYMLYPQQASSSLPNAMSYQASTPPPFTYLPTYDITSSANMDIPRASPPYHQISSSLNSHSPHLGPSQLTSMMEKRYSWRKSGTAGTLTQLSTSLRTEALLAAVEQEISKMKVTLPPSPFLPQSNTRQTHDGVVHANTINNESSKIDGDTSIRPGYLLDAKNFNSNAFISGQSAATTSVAAMTPKVPAGEMENGDLLTLGGKLPSSNSNNQLDIVAKLEKERERRNSDMFLYDDVYSHSRTVSISETTRDRDDDTVDTALMDDDTPFATFRPSFSSASSANPGMAPMFPFSTMTSPSAAALAPILAVINRTGSQKGGGPSHGGTVDGLNGGGVPLPVLARDLQRTVQDHQVFLQQYMSSRNITPTNRGSLTK